jgi:Tfp pilus assembly protein PilZ
LQSGELVKTVLDLLKKYDQLNEAKIDRGKLSPEEEERWEELKVVYELLMFHSGLSSENASAPFSPSEIRETLSDGTRLRVPIEAQAVVQHEGNSFDANVVNVSRGGVFLASETLAESGARLTVYIAGLSDDDEPGDMLELSGEVVWCADEGIPEARIRRGMGIRLVDLSDEAGERLESLVAKTIEKRLSRIG